MVGVATNKKPSVGTTSKVFRRYSSREIVASEVSIHDEAKWQDIVENIAQDCASRLGLQRNYQKFVNVKLSKIIILQSGQSINQETGGNEREVFGKLIIQLPSKHTGGALNVTHGKEKKTYNLCQSSDTAVIAVSFYSDCEHHFSPVGEGWKLCLEYDLSLSLDNVSSGASFPSASSVIRRIQYFQSLVSSWDFNCIHGYLLDDDYLGSSFRKDQRKKDLLSFKNLKGRDRAIVNLLRGCSDKHGNRLLSVCLLLIQDEEHDCDYGRVEHDDENMAGVDLDFDIEEHLLTTEDDDDIFHKHEPVVYSWYDDDDSEHEIESHCRTAIVFWPKSKDAEVMISSGTKDVLSSFSTRAPEQAIKTLGMQVVELLKNKKRPLTTDMLSLLHKTKNNRTVARALKFCDMIDSKTMALLLAEIQESTDSEEIEVEILELIKRTAATKSTNDTNYLSFSFLFLRALKIDDQFSSDARKFLVYGAVMNKEAMEDRQTINKLLQVSLESEGDVFSIISDGLNADDPKTKGNRIVAAYLTRIGDKIAKNPLAIKLLKIRTTELKRIIEKGPPSSESKYNQPSARY